MSAVKSFEELEVWKNARLFCKAVYDQTNNVDFNKDFGLKDQIRRASISVVSNIAEGFERETDKEFGRFLYIAKASAGEVRAQLYIAYDLNYIDTESFEDLKEKITVISKMISKYITYLKY